MKFQYVRGNVLLPLRLRESDGLNQQRQGGTGEKGVDYVGVFDNAGYNAD